MSDYESLLFQIADLKRIVMGMSRVGTIKEVKGDKMRVVMGKNGQGEEVLSPWLHSSNHRGGATERRFYKVGQTVMVHMPGGDPRQAMVLPYAPNNDFKAPDIADDAKPEEETYQLGELRIRQTADGYDLMLGKDGGTGKFRINKDGGFTAKVGDARVAAHGTGSKIKFGNTKWLTITKDGIFVSQNPVVGPDTIPDDNN